MNESKGYMLMGLMILFSCEQRKKMDNKSAIVQETHIENSQEGHFVGDEKMEEREAQYLNAAYNIPVDKGKVQSPINILTKQIVHNVLDVKFNFKNTIIDIKNTGHTVQLDFSRGSFIEKKGIEYELRQLHFHTPSEHMIDGITYPMVMHVVSTIVDSTLIEKGNDQYIVFAYMFKMGEKNKFIEEFIYRIPSIETKFMQVKEDEVKLIDMITRENDEHFKYYHYEGSLTTPPYTESVSWYICSTPLEASPEQIIGLNKIIGNNARHIQDINGREVNAN